MMKVHLNRNVITSTFFYIRFLSLDYFVFQFFSTLSDLFLLFTSIIFFLNVVWIGSFSLKKKKTRKEYTNILLSIFFMQFYATYQDTRRCWGCFTPLQWQCRQNKDSFSLPT